MDVDTALSEVPVNALPLIDDTDFKTREESVTYDQSGLDLLWNFVTTAGAFTQTAVTPTESAGDYDWTNQGNGLYTIEIPASGGASINNDTEGFGWFTGFATGILPWRGPTIGFRAAGLNNVLIDSAYSTTRGLTGTAVPDAAADAAGGLVVSDAGAQDIDTAISNIAAILVDTGTDGVAIATGALDAAALAADAADEIAAAVWDEDATGHQTAGTFGEALGDPVASGNTIRDLVAAVQTVVDGIQTDLDNGTDGLGALKAILDTTGVLVASVATDAIDAAAMADGANQEIADEVLDRANGIETSFTLRQALRIILAATGGKASGLDTSTAVYRDVGDTTNRISATVDADGNRSAVTLDAS